MRRLGWCIAWILLLCSPLLVASDATETTPPGIGAGLFAQRGLDARATALGGASAAAPQGPATGYYNPAGLMSLDGLSIGGLYCQPYGEAFGSTYQYASVLGPLGVQTSSSTPWGAAVTWMESRIGEIQLWDEQGSAGVTEATGSVYLASVGFRVPGVDVLRFGASVKHYGARLLEGRGRGFGFDLAGIGTGYLGDLRLDVGLNLMDVGSTTVRWTSLSGETDNVIPMTVKVGLAARPMAEVLVLSDLDWMIGRHARDQEVHFGLEFRPVRFLALRGGWAGTLERGGTFTLGVGVRVVGRLTLDYAYVPATVFGASHLLSATVDLSSIVGKTGAVTPE